MSEKLTPKQERFCQEYLVDTNGTQAAIRAGYSENSANEQASQLLAKLNVKTRVQQLMDKRSKRTGVSSDRVLQEIERLALFDPKDLVKLRTADDIANLPEDVRRAIVGWKYDKDGMLEIKLVKEKALEMLGRHLKMFTDKVEHSGEVKLEQLVAMASEKPDVE